MRFRPPSLTALLFMFLVVGSAFGASGARTTPLAPAPDWAWLDSWQGRITRREVLKALEEHYAPNNAASGFVEVGAHSVRIRVSGDEWREVAFGSGGCGVEEMPRYWRRASEMGSGPDGRPLEGVRIAIDPGHLGGAWAKMEERYFRLSKGRAVVEGDMTLQVAKKLRPRLERLGAKVTLLRENDRPNTQDRPETLLEAVRGEMSGPFTPEKARLQSELFFYRISEIRARAQRVNEQIRPDMVLCLHFNAEEWGEPDNPKLAVRNHLHALVNGCYSARELAFEDVRSEMVEQLFSGTASEAIPLNEAVVTALAQESGLPPFTYFGSNAKRVGNTAYVYARNLLASRLYKAPVVFLEPYVMNSEPVWKRVQMGDYWGERVIDGVPCRSLVNEYVEGVVKGLADFYEKARR